MKIKPEFVLQYEDDITIVRKEADGSFTELSPISETAAIAWENLARGVSFEGVVNAIVTEFEGADRNAVTADLKALMAQLVALGYGEE